MPTEIVFRGSIRPKYIPIAKGLYDADELCVGVRTAERWQFSPIGALNAREIVNHDDAVALCYCLLAGLAIAIDGNILRMIGLL